jgi:hypothetical protein
MKIAIQASRQQGGALIVTLVITGLIGFTLGSYLKLTSAQNQSLMRSLSWNSSISVAEAGLEEGLTHLTRNTMAHLGADYWTRTQYPTFGGAVQPGTYYVKQRELGDTYYRVAISETSPPILLAEGYVRSPLSTNYIMRAIRVTTQGQSMFPKGLVAKGAIDLNGQNVKSDSFDSQDPNHSTDGKYDPAKKKDNGDMATNSGITGIFNVGNANIYGHASTGPGGSVTVGSNGAVGDSAWQASHNGIQPGWVTDDMNVQFPDVTVPFTSGYSTPSGNPLSITSSGNWQITGDLYKSVVVQANVQAVLVITGDVSLTGNNDYIQIKSGASLVMYVQGANAKIAGQGVVNETGDASKFLYMGLPSNTSLAFSGNANFIGAIYAPNAAFTLGGGGNDIKDFSGAGVVSTVKMNGHFNFHYDENLGRTLRNPSFVITSWNEI